MQLLVNNASALLVGAISAGATSLTVESARADLFPVATTTNWLTPLNWFKATIEDVSGNVEIVFVGVRTAASGIMSTLLRGQEGTTARSFPAGSVVELRPTAGDLQAGANAVVRTGGVASAMLGQLVLSGDAVDALGATPKQQVDASVASAIAALRATLEAEIAAAIGTGAVANGALYENKTIISADYTLTAATNAHAVGPLTINSGKTLTVPTGARLVLL